ncbi:MAG: helix-turn-helix transcriptional regulator [Pseudomonadota bacterium]
MDIIDADWLNQRLTGRRGEQAELAQAMGINDDKMSKILKGKRRVQPEEIPKVLAFFGVTDENVDPELAAVWKELHAKERVLLLSVARAQILSRDQSDETDSSDDE